MAYGYIVAVLAAFLSLVGAVTASVDWSPAAVQDPARTIGVDPQAVVRFGESGDRLPFSYVELMLFIGVGLIFLVSGLVLWRNRPRLSPGTLLVAAGLLWIAGGFRRSSDPSLFTVGVILTWMYQPPLLHLALSFPYGGRTSRATAWFVRFFYISWLAITVLEWVFFDPRLHVSSGQSTSNNLLLIRDDLGLTDSIGDAVLAFQLCIGILIVIILVSRWRTGTAAYRAAFLPLWLAGLVKTLTAMWIALAVVQVSGPLTAATILLQYPATAGVPLAILIGLWRYRFARGYLGDLMVEIGDTPVGDRLVRALRKAVRDPTLGLWLWSSISQRYVDEDGKSRSLPTSGTGRSAMVLERAGTPFGALVFDEALSDQTQLLAAVRGAASLALDNQRLEQQLRDQLVEVRRSRERIVNAGDERRRQLERDLHDGVQQRLLAAAIGISRAGRASDLARARALLVQAGDEVGTAIREVRELARGVYPPVLRDKGLVGALESLAAHAPIPVEIYADPLSRHPEAVELAAYFIVAESVTNAVKHSAASHVRVMTEAAEGEFRMKVIDDGCGGATPGLEGGLLGMMDRAAALGGSLTIHSPKGHGTTLIVRLPFLLESKDGAS